MKKINLLLNFDTLQSINTWLRILFRHTINLTQNAHFGVLIKKCILFDFHNGYLNLCPHEDTLSAHNNKINYFRFHHVSSASLSGHNCHDLVSGNSVLNDPRLKLFASCTATEKYLTVRSQN